MRNLTEAEIAAVAGGIERYPAGATRGFRDGEHFARLGSGLLDLYMSFQPGGANFNGTATAFGTKVYYQAN